MNGITGTPKPAQNINNSKGIRMNELNSLGLFKTMPVEITTHLSTFFNLSSLNSFSRTHTVFNEKFKEKLTEVNRLAQRVKPFLKREVVNKKTKPQKIISLFQEKYPKNIEDTFAFYKAVFNKDTRTVTLFLDLIPELKLSNNIERIIALNILCDDKDVDVVELLKNENDVNNKSVLEFINEVKSSFFMMEQSATGNNSKIDVLIMLQEQALYRKSVELFLQRNKEEKINNKTGGPQRFF